MLNSNGIPDHVLDWMNEDECPGNQRDYVKRLVKEVTRLEGELLTAVAAEREACAVAVSRLIYEPRPGDDFPEAAVANAALREAIQAIAARGATPAVSR